jgi:hypothetical protein
VLKREASAAFGVAPEEIPDADLEEFFWAQTTESGSYVLVPQRYLARQGEYPVHPVDGSPRPEGEGIPGHWQGLWYFGDGRWNPGAQRPDHVYADMSNVLGRPFRNPAFTVLKASNFFPAELFSVELFPEGMNYREFMKAAAQVLTKEARCKMTPEAVAAWVPDIIRDLHQRLSDALVANDTLIDVLLPQMRVLMGRTGEMATDEDLAMALNRPDLPVNLSFAGNVGVVRCSAPSRPASTWRLPGVHANLFVVKPWWADRVEPVTGRLEGILHGRASASFAD